MLCFAMLSYAAVLFYIIQMRCFNVLLCCCIAMLLTILHLARLVSAMFFSNTLLCYCFAVLHCAAMLFCIIQGW